MTSRQIIGESATIFAGQFLNIIGMLALVRMLTDRLSTDQYGYLNLALTGVAFVHETLMGAINGGIARYFPIAKEKFSLNTYRKSAGILILYSTIVASVLTIAIITIKFKYKIDLSTTTIVITAFLAVVSSFVSLLNSINNINRNRKLYSIISGAEPWIKMAIIYTLYRHIQISATEVLTGYLLSSLILFMVLAYLIVKINGPVLKAERQSDEDWRRKIWKYSWPMMIWSPFSWAAIASDRWALQTFSSTSDVGLYSVLFQLGYIPLGILTGVLATIISPVLYQIAGDGTNVDNGNIVTNIMKRMLMILIVSCICSFIGAYALHEIVFSVLVSSEYRLVSHLLPWMALAGGLYSTAQFLSLKMMSNAKTKELLTIRIVVSCSTVLLNVCGAAKYGLTGVIFAMNISSVLYLVLMTKQLYIPNDHGVKVC